MGRQTTYLDDLVTFVSGRMTCRELLARVDEHLAKFQRLGDSEDEATLSSLELVLHEVAEEYRERIEAYILALRILERTGKVPVSDTHPSKHGVLRATDLFVLPKYDLDPDKNTPPIAVAIPAGSAT